MRHSGQLVSETLTLAIKHSPSGILTDEPLFPGSDAKRPCSTCVRSHNHAVAHAGPDVVLPPFPECTFDEGQYPPKPRDPASSEILLWCCPGFPLVKDPGFSSNDTPKSKYEKLENRISKSYPILFFANDVF